MKQFICFFFMLFSVGFIFAQSTTEIISIHSGDFDNFMDKSIHKFPVFTKAHVQMKNGEEAIGSFNYDYFLDNFLYINEKNDTVALANGDDVDFVAFPVDSFFYDKKFYQWVASSNIATLAVRYNYKLARKDNVGAFGVATPAIDVDSHSSLLGESQYKFQGNEQLTFEKTTTYYIRKNSGNFVTATLIILIGFSPKKIWKII